MAAPTVTHVCNHKTHGLRFVFCSGTKHKSESLFLCFKYELQVRLVCNQHLLSWKHTACLETLVYQKFLTIYGSFKLKVLATWSVSPVSFGRPDEQLKGINSYSASHDNWCTATLWNRIVTAQCEGMGEVGSARCEPALLPPCPSISVLSYSNCQEIHSRQQTGLAV